MTTLVINTPWIKSSRRTTGAPLQFVHTACKLLCVLGLHVLLFVVAWQLGQSHSPSSQPIALEVRLLTTLTTEAKPLPMAPQSIPPSPPPMRVNTREAVSSKPSSSSTHVPSLAPVAAPSTVAALNTLVDDTPTRSGRSSLETAAAPGNSATPVAAATALPVAVAISPARFDADYLHNPEPAYPMLSKRQGEEGRVLLLVRVTPQGTAEQVSLKQSSGFPRLDEAAQRAVQHWRFVPAKRGDEAVSANVTVPIVFKLDR